MFYEHWIAATFSQYSYIALWRARNTVALPCFVLGWSVADYPDFFKILDYFGDDFAYYTSFQF